MSDDNTGRKQAQPGQVFTIQLTIEDIWLIRNALNDMFIKIGERPQYSGMHLMEAVNLPGRQAEPLKHVLDINNKIIESVNKQATDFWYKKHHCTTDESEDTTS